MKHLLLVLPFSLILTGCLGDLIDWGCQFTDDEGHCYQTSAVQDAEPESCEKVTSDFTNSNPPRDKCHLMIAENTGDPSVCDNIVGGPASYTREDCVANVIRTGNPEDCLAADDETACRTAYVLGGGDCGEAYRYNRAADQCQPVEKESEATELSNAEQADITSLKDAATGKYMELLNQDLEFETDPARKAGLQAYKDFLEKAGSTVETAQTNLEQLQALRRIFLDSYDPAQSIERMSVRTELDPGFYDRLKDRLFGPEEAPTGIDAENADAENGITIYEAMLARQAENDFLKKDKLSRIGDTIKEKFRDQWSSEVTDSAQALAEGIAGPAMGAVTPLSEALEAFQSEAKKQSFIALARAYNRRRAVMEANLPNATAEEIHKTVVEQVKEDPYQDLKGLSPVRFENLLLNDCSNYNGELCIDPHVWWTAMDKTYEYNKKN